MGYSWAQNKISDANYLIFKVNHGGEGRESNPLRDLTAPRLAPTAAQNGLFGADSALNGENAGGYSRLTAEASHA